MKQKVRVGVAGAGVFGRHHLRVLGGSERAELVAAVDKDAARAAQAAEEFGCRSSGDWRDLIGQVDAAVVAVPTTAHAEVGCGLLEAGIDVLVEKPVAASLEDAARLVQAAQAAGRILQVGHLERFNPAVSALCRQVRRPLFFEIHRLSLFTPRSLDVDVVLDLMIHDIDLVLSLVSEHPEEIRAAGISILTGKVDIASVRLAFPGGCVANLTASRVSTERVRKLRLFQPREYLSVDYSRQEAFALRVDEQRRVVPQPLPVERDEPLRLQAEAFLDSVLRRRPPLVGGEQALRALEVCLEVVARIEEHARLVAPALSPS